MWHLVQALNTLVKPDGHTPAVEGFFDKAKPLTPEQLQMIKTAVARRNEQTMNSLLESQKIRLVGLSSYGRTHRRQLLRSYSLPLLKSSLNSTYSPMEKESIGRWQNTGNAFVHDNWRRSPWTRENPSSDCERQNTSINPASLGRTAGEDESNPA